MSAELRDLNEQLDGELREVERSWEETVGEADGERGRLRGLVDAKVNVKAFEELEQIEEWLEGSREGFTIKNPQNGVLSKMTQEKMVK
jgi:hypothetical protein